MASASLAVTARTETGKGAARALRRDGKVPAVIYGHARQPQSLVLDTRELDRLLGRISAENTVVELSLGSGRPMRTLIREIQRHPVKRHVVHVDFQELVAGEKVIVKIPLVLVGTAQGVRDGGIMDQVLRDLTIEVDPSDIPNHLDVDVAELTIGHSVHVRDLALPAGVTVQDDEDATIVVIAAPKTAAEAEEKPEAEAGAEPEVIRKAKTDGDEDEK
jgi:large subunit ribosomal protein L25